MLPQRWDRTGSGNVPLQDGADGHRRSSVCRANAACADQIIAGIDCDRGAAMLRPYRGRVAAPRHESSMRQLVRSSANAR